MDRLKDDQFSLRNFLLAIVPLAAGCWAITNAIRQEASLLYVAVAFIATPAAVGALVKGTKGLMIGIWLGFMLFVVSYLPGLLPAFWN
jgi:hypothetical protein